jgi:2-keto-4-pentenoate hydratase/2-oxohepta-3-ene-1,7-dioic acid hydratase in catechol pathway
MIGLQAFEIPRVTVKTSTEGGLSSEQVAELCCNKIIHVGENLAPEVREQAEAYRNKLQEVIFHYIQHAVRAERDRCVYAAVSGGYDELANLLRSL